MSTSSLDHEIVEVVGANNVTYYQAMRFGKSLGPRRKTPRSAEWDATRDRTRHKRIKDRKSIFARAQGKCEWCGCPEGKVLAARQWGMYAEDLSEKTMDGTPFRRWKNRLGTSTTPPIFGVYKTMVALRIFNGKIAICQRCASAAYRGVHKPTPQKPA